MSTLFPFHNNELKLYLTNKIDLHHGVKNAHLLLKVRMNKKKENEQRRFALKPQNKFNYPVLYPTWFSQM